MTRVAVAVGFLALLTPLAAHAAPFGIQVLSATCSTTVAASASWLPPIATSMTGCASSQSLDEVRTDDFGFARAFASADYFATATSSSSNTAFSSSIADSLVIFSPLTDGTALLSIDYDQLSVFSNKQISLVDLTMQVLIWEQIWGRSGDSDGTFGSFGLSQAEQGSLAASTDFTAAHQYALHLHTNGDSQNDHTATSLRVSGLVAVPEPSSLLLLSAGLAGVGVFRRARTRQSRS